MANTVLEVGTGIFVIAVVWIVVLVFGILLLRVSGSANLEVLPVFLLALTIALVLVFFPHNPETPLPFKDVEIVDTLFISHYVLLAAVSAIFLVAFFMLLPFHFLEPVYAKALKTY